MVGEEELMELSVASKSSIRISGNINRSFLGFIPRCSSFINSIMIVISSCTEKQMVRINTTPVIAFMTNIQVPFNGTYAKFIGKSMSLQQLMFSSFRNLTTKNAVSILIPLSTPFPTGMKRNKFYSFFKAQLNGFSFIAHSEILAGSVS